METAKFKTNQSGSFGNRVNFHDAETEEKLFVLEHAETDNETRLKLTNLVKSAPDLYEALQVFIKLRALIEYPDKENESDQYQGEAQAIFVAFKKAEAALHLAQINNK